MKTIIQRSRQRKWQNAVSRGIRDRTCPNHPNYMRGYDGDVQPELQDLQLRILRGRASALSLVTTHRRPPLVRQV
jgi:hypothetical protein